MSKHHRTASRATTAGGATRLAPRRTAAREPDGQPPVTSRALLIAAAAALATMLIVLFVAGGSALPVAGLTDPGPLTRWGLPVFELLSVAAGVVTVGLVLLAALLPPIRSDLAGEALRALRGASTAAMVWSLATAGVHLLTLSDLLGRPLTQVFGGTALASYTSSIPQGQATGLVVLMAATVSVAARMTIGHGGAVALLCLAVATLIPPALTGHAASGDYHHSAAVSLIVHVVAISLWVGGLVALGAYAASGGRHVGRVATRFSAVALASAVAVAASGVLNAYVRLASPLELATSGYGRLLVLKAALLAALIAMGAQHRSRTLPALGAGRPNAFRRLAASEVVVMGVAMGLGVALGRTPPPLGGDDSLPTLSRQLLGFPLPAAPDFGRIFTQVYPDAFFGLLCLAMALAYVGGTRRLQRRGDEWPPGRTASWLAGVAVLAFATLSGLMTYGMTMLSWHMVQHMVMAMVVPPLLVLGAPVTLALRALPSAPRGEAGPRDWLLAVLHSRPARLMTNPLVAFVLFASAPFGLYFTAAFEFAMRHHTAHLLMGLHFVLVGYLFAQVLVGVDPIAGRLPFVVRIILLFAAMALHAFFGVALMSSARLIAADWYGLLANDIAWLPEALGEQRTAGQIAWALGELPALAIVLVMVVQWSRADEREAKRQDRHGADEALKAYNAYLASLDERR